MNKQNSIHDVIAIGDSTQDVFLELSDASVQCELDVKNCKLLLDYGDKIAVNKKTDVPAVGNAANHAVGMARLGKKAAIYTIVGDDTQGHIAGDIFRTEGVDVRYLAYDKVNGTNFSAVINFQGERTILVFHEKRTYKLPHLTRTQWIYLTSSSGDGAEILHQQVVNFLEDNPETKMAFNPGTHQIKLGREKLLSLLSLTEVLFVNREEAAELLGVKTRDIKELIQEFHTLGVKQIVITDGPDGAYASDGKIIWNIGIFVGPVIERTGAGDSFGAGFLGGLLSGANLAEAMLWGSANSTSVVRFIGAREGLLTARQIQNMINENPAVRPREFATL